MKTRNKKVHHFDLDRPRLVNYAYFSNSSMIICPLCGLDDLGDSSVRFVDTTAEKKDAGVYVRFFCAYCKNFLVIRICNENTGYHKISFFHFADLYKQKQARE